MTRHAKRFLWGTTILVAGLLVWVAIRPRPVVVETAVVIRGPLTVSVVAEGRTRVKDMYVIAAPVDGELERLALEPGDAVRVGATLARVWPVTPRPLDARSRAEAIASVAGARSAVLQAEAMEREATTAVNHAQTQYETLRSLVRDGAAASKEAEHAGHELEARRESLDAATAAVKTA